MPVNPVLTAYRAAFESDLVRYGFVQRGDDRWYGTVRTWWYDDRGTRHVLDEEIAIELREGFPFDKPRVTACTDDPAIGESLHREPSGRACLWRDDSTGWAAGMTVSDVLARVADWFTRCRQRSWRDDEQPPDLHLYYEADTPPTMVVTGDDWRPPEAARIGRFSWWQTNRAIAYVGDPQTALATPAVTTSNAVFRSLRIGSNVRREIGIWLRLDVEPKVARTLHDVIVMGDSAVGKKGATVTNVTSLLGTKVRNTERLRIAVGYPDAKQHQRWLFLTANVGVREGKRWSTPEGLDAIKIEACVTAPGTRQALARRVGDPVERLLQMSIAIFGLGALGSEIAVLLAKSGAGKMRLIDSDRLTPTNAIRHVAGLRYAGFLKTQAVEQEILEHAPFCKIEVAGETWSPDEITKLIDGADLIIDATARTAFSGLLNEVAIRSERPVMYVTAHRRGGIGRIRLVRPHADACVTCYDSSGGHRDGASYPTIPLMDEGEFLEDGCAAPTVTAAAIHLQVTANAAARVALSLLTGADASSHTWVVVVPAEDAAAPLTEAGVHSASYAPLVDCESCGQADGLAPS